MMGWTDDPAMDEMRHTQRKEDALEEYPTCGCCDEKIQDDYFYIINGEYVCQGCLDENFKVRTEDYIG